MKKKTYAVLMVIILITILVLLGSFLFYKYQLDIKNKEEKQLKLQDEKLIKEISNHYNEFVKVSKDTKLYVKINNKYKEIGTIYKDKSLILNKVSINKYIKYFKIKDTDYYINYKDVEKIDTYSIDQRYKNYIYFNTSIITKKVTNLYQNDKLVMTINKSFDLPIIIKDESGNYVEVNNELYLIKNEDIKTTYEKENTNKEVAENIPVTVYHFLYLNGDNTCNEEICHSENQIKDHFNYLKENNFFTLNTHELLLFIENKINLPKSSVLVTIDDGARAVNFIPLLEEYKINATLFLIASWYDKNTLKSNYLELGSHTTNLHTPGKCSGGQGSALKCENKNMLLSDLKTSRDYLYNTEAFCFPFYEFNDYAISIVKEAGFKIAFIGGMKKVTRDIDPYKTPRISLNRNTTLYEYKNIVNPS